MKYVFYLIINYINNKLFELLNSKNHFQRRSAHSTRCPNSSSCGDLPIWPAKWTNALQTEYWSTWLAK